MRIRVGTRKSNLALIQTNIAISYIKSFFPNFVFEIIPIVTTGDKILDKNLYDIGGKALFLKELEEQLLQNNIDIAVHSLKDVPGIIDDKLKIAAVLPREDPRDCFVSYKYKSINDLPIGGVLGTSSVRRKAVILKNRPDLEIINFRGNLDTRLDKLKKIDATILACAGLERSNKFDKNYCFPIDINYMLPASGQGSIAIEIKSDNKKMLDVCKTINHIPSWNISIAERSFMEHLEADCRTAVGSYACFSKDDIGKIEAKYMIIDKYNNIIYFESSCNLNDVYDMGRLAADYLKSKV